MNGWIPYAAVALAVAAIWGHGYNQGQAARDAAGARALAVAQAEAAAVARRVSAAELARLEAERERDDLREQLDAQGRIDPDADRRAFSADSMRRIGQIGGGQ